MLKRNPDFVQSKLYVKDNKVYCKEKCIIEFPKWYEDKDLASIQDTAYVYGIFAIMIGEEYSVSTIPTLCTTIPIMIKEIERNGIVYYQFIYGKDDCIIDNTKVIKHELLSYNFFETYYMYARAPWYVEYEDLVKIMDNLPNYSKSNVGGNFIVNELTTSFITRNKSDKRVFYRQVVGKPYEYVDLMSPYYGMLSTTNRIGGSFFNAGLVSAIVQKEEQTTKLEDLVRQ